MYKILPQNKCGGHCYAYCKFLLVMKLIVICLLTTILQVSAKTYAQRITMSHSNVPLEQVLKEIGKQSGYDFFYSMQLIKKANLVTVNLKNVSIEEALMRIFTNQPVTYTIANDDKAVVIKVLDHAARTPAAGTAFFALKGRVTDENGLPLPGASIKMLVSGEVVVSDSEGRFSLRNLNGEPVIECSYIGYVTQQIRISNNMQSLDIKMLRADNKLDEVVLVGYGTSTKRLNTGAVSSVTAKDITSQPLANPLAALAGRVSGMTITQNNGLPGGNFKVQIRGQNSLQSGANPLYVIDGVPFSGEDLNRFGIGAANGGISAFSMINPSDIERIDVLKDGDATAIYGARGANGVVLITTKRGNSGAARLNANVYRGAGKVSHFIPMLNTQQYLELRREAFANDGVAPDEFNAPDLTLYDQNKYTNWQKEIIGGTANVTDAQTSFSGGNNNIRFLINANYRKEGTVFKGNMGTERVGTRMNLDYISFGGRFSASASAAFSADKTNLVTMDLTNTYNLPPNMPLYNEDGSLFWDSYQQNPLGTLNQKYKGLTNTLLGNATLKYTPLEGLQLKMNLGYNQTTLDQKSAYPSASFNPAFGMASLAMFGNSRMQNYIIEPTADYSIKSSNWKLNFLAGASWQSTNSTGQSIMGENYSNDALLGSIVAAGNLVPQYGNIDEYNFNSVFGRVNYNYKEKYLLNLTYRRDGSSKFGKNNRFGNFGAGGMAWVFSEEEFMKSNFGFLSFGKLRASYGLTGNDQIENYRYLPLYTLGNPYQQQPGTYVMSTSNPDIRWESTRKMEFALDLGLWKDRFLLGINYYRNRSDNQIISTSIGTQSGFKTYIQNIDALIQNSGLEFDLSSKNVAGINFTWNTRLNITLPNSKLLEFPGLETSFYQDTFVIGQPVNGQRYYNYLGIDAATGVASYQDLNEDGVPDLVPAPVGTPFYGGISNTLTFKNWSLDFLIQFNHQNGLRNRLSSYNNAAVLGNMSNQNNSVADRWRSAGNTGTLFPAATADQGTPLSASYDYFNDSNAFFGDASFIRFKSANLSYKFHGDWLNKLRIADLNIYFQGQNLLTLTKNKYVFDPETSGLGIGTMPALRTFVLGLNCSF